MVRHVKHRMPPLLEEFLVAGAAMILVGVIFAVGFDLVTGLSPWPFVVLAEIAGFGWGTVMLALTSPRNPR